MKPYYQDDACTIYHGDARDVLPTLPQRSVAAVITDPPYGFNYSSGWSPTAKVTLDGTRACLRLYRDVLPSLRAVMATDSHLYWFTRWDAWADTSDALAPYLPVANALVWDKGHPGMGNLTLYGYSYELAAFVANGKRPIRGSRQGNIFRCRPVPPVHREHPTEKPAGLLEEWIRASTDEVELVLDPFMGVGPTLEAAQKLGRKAIGIEIEERYCEIAAKRLAQEVLALASP